MKKEQKRWIVDQNSQTLLESEWGVPLNAPEDFARRLILTPNPHPPTTNIIVYFKSDWNYCYRVQLIIQPDWDGQITILFWRRTEEFWARVAKSEVLVKSDSAQNALRQYVGAVTMTTIELNSELNSNHSTVARSFDFNHLWQLQAALQNLM